MNNIKIRVSNPEESRVVQERLIGMGCSWAGGDKFPKFLDETFLYVDGNSLTYGGGETYFQSYHNPEMTVKELLGLKSGKLPKPVPVDKHVVIKDSCGNFVGIRNSYKEAEELAKGSDGNMTIYKMTEVAKVTSERTVKKVTLKK